MKWYVINKTYIEYIRQHEKKIQIIEYGDRFKPYLGIILAINEIKYYIPISSPKPKHQSMKQTRDFMKIIDNNGILLAVLNINNMIPVPDHCVVPLLYNQIDQYRQFDSEHERTSYVSLLKNELHFINLCKNAIIKNATYLHKHYEMHPNDALSKRCCDFILLERKCTEYPNNTKSLM